MGQISLQMPQVGLSDLTEEPKIPSDFAILQTLVNGNIDASNLSPGLAQEIGANQSGQTSKGAASIATSESRTNTAYGTLTTPDQVTGIVLPSDGLIAVRYQATWQESVSGAARAAIFIGANQLVVSMAGTLAAPQTQAATSNGGTPAVNRSLVSSPVGLVTGGNASASYSGDVATGQAIAIAPSAISQPFVDIGGFAVSLTAGVSPPGAYVIGGSCEIFAAAGTYTISVQFKASSGSVTASNRKLWVEAKSFA